MITVYCFDVSSIDESKYAQMYNSSSEKRKSKAKSIKAKDSAVRCIAVEFIIKYGLKRTGEDTLPAIMENEYGKPYFENLNNVHFNASHSGKWVCVAFSESEVGIDVECISRASDKEGISNRFFTQRERDYVYSDEDAACTSVRWANVWTLKESYIKYIGKGLSKRLDSFEVLPGKCGFYVKDGKKPAEEVFLSALLLDDDYALSVCGKEKEIKTEKIHFEEIIACI